MQYFIAKPQELYNVQDLVTYYTLAIYEIPEIWSTLASITPEPSYSALRHIALLCYFEAGSMRLRNLRLHFVIRSIITICVEKFMMVICFVR